MSANNIPNSEAAEDNSSIKHRNKGDNLDLDESNNKNIRDEYDTQFEDKEIEPSRLGDAIILLRRPLIFCTAKKALSRTLGLVVFALLYNAFLIAAIYHGVTYGPEDGLNYCSDVGFLIIVTVIVYTGIFYFCVIKRYLAKAICQQVVVPLQKKWQRFINYKWATVLIYSLVLTCILIFIIADVIQDGEPRRLISLFGIFVLILFGYVFSAHPQAVVWRHVAWGLFLQFIFGLLILRWKVGKQAFQCIGNKVAAFLDHTDSGSAFVFGYLVDQKPFMTTLLNGTALEVAEQINKSGATAAILMFKILSIIYFFNFCVSMLFYLGVLQWVVVKLGWLLQITVGTTVCESVTAAGNIFLGQTEAPLMVKPYLKDLTRSEIHAIMTNGFATIAGSLMGAYISLGISASHLVTASVMSAPAALAFAKLFYPETKKSKTTSENLIVPKCEEVNLLDAATNGATQAVFLVANIASTLIAFLALVSLLNAVLSWLGGLVGAPLLSLELIMGWVFYPMAWLMGVQPSDCEQVGVLIGIKAIVNEFAAYQKLAEFVQQGTLSDRSQALATYALCSVANPASIGEQIAALSFMSPTRRGDISRVAFRAFISGSVASLLTACIAGALIQST